MKKLIAMLIVAIVGAFAWGKYAARDPELRDPELAVRTLMSELAQISALTWDRGAQETAKAALEDARKNPEKGIPDEVGALVKGTGRFFADKGIGKAVLSTFMLASLDTYTVEAARTEGARVRVPVVFTPKDVLGIRSLASRLGVPEPPAQTPKPQRLELLLESRKGRWRIVDVEGGLASILKGFRR